MKERVKRKILEFLKSNEGALYCLRQINKAICEFDKALEDNNVLTNHELAYVFWHGGLDLNDLTQLEVEAALSSLSPEELDKISSGDI
jgi:hypothetical protein